MKMLMKNGLIALAAACAFGSGALGAAWAQSQTGESATDATRREASSDKAVDKKAAAKKESASRKAAAAKKEKEAVAERASRIDPEAPVLAAGGVFKCVDRDGNITYGNVGDVKGCKKIDTEAPNTVPFPKPSAPTAGRAPSKSEGSGAQRTRDTDRRRILQEELASEEKKLAELKKEFNGGEPERRGDEKNFAKYQERTDKLKADVTRSESNIESLRREISAIRD